MAEVKPLTLSPVTLWQWMIELLLVIVISFSLTGSVTTFSVLADKCGIALCVEKCVHQDLLSRADQHRSPLGTTVDALVKSLPLILSETSISTRYNG